jgi:hypothetical protein
LFMKVIIVIGGRFDDRYILKSIDKKNDKNEYSEHLLIYCSY